MFNYMLVHLQNQTKKSGMKRPSDTMQDILCILQLWTSFELTSNLKNTPENQIQNLTGGPPFSELVIVACFPTPVGGAC